MIAGCCVSAILKGSIMFTCDSALERQASYDLACRDDLAGVALGMFSCVEQQPENIAGEPGPTNRTSHEKLFLRDLFQAMHRVL